MTQKWLSVTALPDCEKQVQCPHIPVIFLTGVCNARVKHLGGSIHKKVLMWIAIRTFRHGEQAGADRGHCQNKSTRTTLTDDSPSGAKTLASFNHNQAHSVASACRRCSHT